MSRVRFDMHYIPADNIDRALKLLLDAGLVTGSHRGESLSSARDFERWCPEKCAILKVKSIY